MLMTFISVSINGPKFALFTVNISIQPFKMLIVSGSTLNILDKTTVDQLVPKLVLNPSTAQIFLYLTTEKVIVNRNIQITRNCCHILQLSNSMLPRDLLVLYLGKVS